MYNPQNPVGVCVITLPTEAGAEVGAQRRRQYQHKLLKLWPSVTVDQAID